MKKIIRLTESDLTRLVKRIVNEMDDTKINGNNFCVKKVKQWEDIDDDVQQTGTWKVSGNKINLYYGGMVSNITHTITKTLGIGDDIDDSIPKPNGFDQWRGSSVSGKFKKSMNKLSDSSFSDYDYSVCFTK
jgi:hypothetical protein